MASLVRKHLQIYNVSISSFLYNIFTDLGNSEASSTSDVSPVDGIRSTSDVSTVDGIGSTSDVSTVTNISRTPDVPTVDGIGSTSVVSTVDGIGSTSDVSTVDDIGSTFDVSTVDETIALTTLVYTHKMESGVIEQMYKVTTNKC